MFKEFDSGNDSIDLNSQKEIRTNFDANNRSHIREVFLAGMSGSRGLVGGQQAAVVLVQHEVLHIQSVVHMEPIAENARAQPIVGGQIHFRLANIEVLTFGSWKASNFTL